MRADIKIKSQLSEVFSYTRIVASGVAGSINAGEPTKKGTSGAVAIMVDGDGTTSQVFTGISKSDSTDTVAAAGAVTLWLPLPGIIYSAKAKSTTAAITQALIDALMDKRVVFDLTGTSWTIDSAAADSTANGLLIVGGDSRKNTLDFIMRPSVTTLNNVTT